MFKLKEYDIYYSESEYGYSFIDFFEKVFGGIEYGID